MAKRKILVSINSSWNFVNFRSGLLRGLQDEGFEVVALAPDDGHASSISGMGIRYIPVSFDRRGTSLLAELRLLGAYRRVLQAERPAAQLTFTVKPNIWGSLAARSLGIPTIANIAGLGTIFLRKGALNRGIRRMYALALNGAETVFFQNPEDLELFVSAGIVPGAKAKLLPGSGVDLDRFAPAPLPSVTNAGAGRTGPIFLMLARLLWAKGIGEYVEAARLLRERWPGSEFRLLGIEEKREGAISLEQVNEWHESGWIRFLGSMSDVRPAIAEADCVVLPSYYPEGTPRSLLEAAAMARPIVTTDLPGCRDVVVGGHNGYLCAPRDAQSLADALERVACLSPAERARMGEQSRELAEKRFDERLVIDRYIAALHAVQQ